MEVFTDRGKLNSIKLFECVVFRGIIMIILTLYITIFYWDFPYHCTGRSAVYLSAEKGKGLSKFHKMIHHKKVKIK